MPRGIPNKIIDASGEVESEHLSQLALRVTKFKAEGVKLSKAVFHDTILSWGGRDNGEPEHALYWPKPGDPTRKSRTAKLFLLYDMLMIEQLYKGETVYKFLHMANVKDNDALLDAP